MRPGWRESRSSGPETDTAAMILPRRGADRGGHRGHALLALADGLRPAASPDAGQRGRGEGGVLQTAVHPLRVLPGEQDLGSGAGAHGQLRADRDGVAQTGRPLGGGDADPVVALAAPHLGRLAGDVAQPGEHRAGRGEQPVLTGGRGQLGRAGGRGRSGPACRGPPAGGARARPQAGARSDGPARCRPRARPAWPVRPRVPTSTRAALSSTPTPLELSIL